MIVFENPGEIDVRSISTFGISVKQSSNPIGFFGTGLKYAIAVLLRTGHKVIAQSGDKVIYFDTKADSVRGQEFDFITMTVSGEQQTLGFTTELGKTWEVWMAYREIACNCKDEGGTARFEQDCLPLPPEAGKTRILVIGQPLEAVYASRTQYILEDEPWFKVGEAMEVRRYPSNHFFYRGVRVSQLHLESVYTYNTLEAMDLTEDRTTKNSWEPAHRIAKAVLTSTNKRFIREVLGADKNTVEGRLDFHGWSVKPSEEFLAVVGDLLCDKLMNVNKSALQVWQDATKKELAPREIELTKVQQISMERALDFCTKLGFQIRDAYPIKVVESLGTGVLGLAHNETIFIAEQVFTSGGTKQLASTLIEEFLHLRHGWKDLSRELQTFLFDKLVSVGEELVGAPL